MSVRSYRLRTNPARFNTGDKLRVRPVIFSRFVGQVGSVMSVHISRAGSHTLDKYRLMFSDGSEAEFWDVQLETIVDDKTKSPPCAVLEPQLHK
jgi:hypothetical protein